MRDYCRSTRAHNTVEIDGQDQAEFWGAFRVARRGRVLDVKWLSCDDGFELSALHDGFARLPGKPVHHRTFRWHDRGELFVKDLLSSAAEHRVVSRIHLHPDCRIVEMSDKQARVSFAKGELAIEFEGTAQAVSEDSHYCPEFGLRLKNQAIAWSGRLAGQTEWSMRIRLM
jgi:uncharacterized heparinase superfamily protein